jgi:hypothetical protein
MAVAASSPPPDIRVAVQFNRAGVYNCSGNAIRRRCCPTVVRTSNLGAVAESANLGPLATFTPSGLPFLWARHINADVDHIVSAFDGAAVARLALSGAAQHCR